MATYYATRPFWWNKNINPGDPIELSGSDARRMLARGAVTDKAPPKPAPKKKAKAKK